MPQNEPAVERLIRQVEARVALKEELRASLRGLATTALLLAAIVGLLAAVVGGAIVFATVLHVFAR